MRFSRLFLCLWFGLVGCGSGTEPVVDAGPDGELDAGLDSGDTFHDDGGDDGIPDSEPDGLPDAFDGGDFPGDTSLDAGDTAGDEAGDSGGDTGPGTFCRRSSACGELATCNLASGLCEARATEPGDQAAILSVYPLAGAPGDFLVIDGEGFYTTLIPDWTASLVIGQASFGSMSMGFDENRIVVTRTADTSGPVQFSANSGTADFEGPVQTDAAWGTGQTCGADDPPATGVDGQVAAEAGPYAAGFADGQGNGGYRIYYPAECGGLRRPAVAGSYPLVMTLHGDGCNTLNYEFLGRHLASWGFLVLNVDSTAVADIQALLTSGLQQPELLFSGLSGLSAGGQAVVVGHSMGSDRTGQLFDAGEGRILAVIFLGPVSQHINYPVAGMVFGASEDRQSIQGTYENIFNELQRPRYLVVLQGGNHSQFTDDKHWEGWAIGDGQASMSRNRQFELVQSFVLAYLQHLFGQAELFPDWLQDPAQPDVVFSAQLP
jgi:hypothetical protein